jgi:hypothetical protein
LKVWAWVWLGGLALLGWAPGLLVSYAMAFDLALGAGWDGSAVLGSAYYGILLVSLVLLIQVGKHFGLAGGERKWFTWAGGGGLALVWVGAYLGFRVLSGSP